MRINNSNFFDDDAHPLFILNRNKRKDQLQQIIIEVMRRLARGPLTKSELQKLVRIRRKIFLRHLKYFVEVGVVIRTGQGGKGSPFRYQLADHYRAG